MNRKNEYIMITNVDTGITQRVLGSFKLSENFEVWEFVSDNSESLLYSQKHINILQAIRDYFNLSIIVNRGCSTLSTNTDVGGSEDSEHLYGYASDIKIDGVTHLELWRICVLYGGYLCNVGLYETHVHFGTMGYHRRA